MEKKKRDFYSLRDKSKIDAKSWCIIHGTHTPTLQKIILNYLDNHVLLLVVKEIGVHTLIYYMKMKINKMIHKRTDDLIFVYSNLRNSSKYKEEETKLWNVTGHDFSLDDNEMVKIATLSLDELKLEIVFFNKNELI